MFSFISWKGDKEQVGHAAPPTAPPPLRLQKFLSFAEAASTFCGARPLARVDGGGDSLSHCQPGVKTKAALLTGACSKNLPAFPCLRLSKAIMVQRVQAVVGWLVDCEFRGGEQS